jgi:hypothetical protein
MRIRINKGIYLPAVSAALDISVYVLKNIKNGKYPTLKILTLYILAKFFPLLVSHIFNLNDMQEHTTTAEECSLRQGKVSSLLCAFKKAFFRCDAFFKYALSRC